MARNYEKNFGRLNRLWLEKETGKKEKRPKLSTLKTAEEISHWLPSIKQDLDFFLKQTEVPCYTDRKVDECRKQVMFLEAEYKAFVRKLHQLNSKLKSTPWTPRPYENKSSDKPVLSLHPLSADMQLGQISPLHTPVLQYDTLYQDSEDACESVDSAFDHQEMDQMLRFSHQTVSAQSITLRTAEQEDFRRTEPSNSVGGMSLCIEPNSGEEVSKQNPLGLDYSSSEDEDEL